jgi:DNA excision repair protein ERCC-4
MRETAPVLVDHRERASAVPAALVAAGLDVRLTDLPVGDYVLGAGLAVERKGPADLGASIRDGRIFEQAERLQSAFPQAVLLLEGEPRHVAEDAWRGAVCRLVEDGFTVLHSLDVDDSAAWIARLAKRARRTGPTVRSEGPRRVPRHPSAQAEVMLSVVPGISRVRATRLAEAFHGDYVAPADRAPEVERRTRRTRPLRRWVLSSGDEDDVVQSFDRRAIGLRALRAAAHGSKLVDGLTGEVVAVVGDRSEE